MLLIFVSINLWHISRKGFKDTSQGEKAYFLIGFVEMGITKIISDFNVLAQTPRELHPRIGSKITFVQIAAQL